MVDFFDNYSGNIYGTDKDVCLLSMLINVDSYQKDILLYDYCMTQYLHPLYMQGWF